jgi:predicted ester cyclase
MADNKEIVRHIEEAWDRDDFAELGRLIAADIVNHDAPPGFPTGLEGATFGHKMFKASFPDSRHEITQLIGEGDLVTVANTTHATHTGEPFLGVPTTHRQVHVGAISIYRIKDGKAVEHWGLNDGISLMMQLGAMQAPGAAAPA